MIIDAHVHLTAQDYFRCDHRMRAPHFAVKNPKLSNSLALWSVPYEMKRYYTKNQIKKQIRQLNSVGVIVNRDNLAKTWNIEDLLINIRYTILLMRGLADRYFKIAKYQDIIKKLRKHQAICLISSISYFGHEIDKNYGWWQFYVRPFVNFFKTTLQEAI